MKRILISLLAAAAFLPIPAFSQDDSDPRFAPGQAAAAAWLALTDVGLYGGSWDKSATSFQAAVPRAAWLAGIANLRDPLGKLISRSPASVRFTDSIAGAPDGEYISIVYESEFEKKKDAVETVTTKHEQDGSWKVMGYQLK